MPFDDADAYQRFMGRFSDPLASHFAAFAGLAAQPGSAQRGLDVGCGPGALTRVLAAQLGASSVAAVDPSEPFVTALRRSLPGVDARVASAERLPHGDDDFAAALAQLVVHFMRDPVAGVAEMARVTRPGGVVAVCVWDHAAGRGPLSAYWSAATRLWPDTVGEAHRTGSTEGDLERVCREAGLADVEGGELEVTVRMDSFEAWFAPFTLGVGPAGEHYDHLDVGDRRRLEQALREQMPDGPFDATVTAWAARATVG